MKSSIVTLGLFLICSCTQFKNFSYQLTRSSSYDRYANSLKQAGLQETSLVRDWLETGQNILQDTTRKIILPFSETAYFAGNRVEARAYRLQLKAGQLINIQVKTSSRNFQVFTNLFFLKGKEQKEKLIAIPPLDLEKRKLQFTIENSGEYVVRLQPQLLVGGRYEFNIELNQ